MKKQVLTLIAVALLSFNMAFAQGVACLDNGRVDGANYYFDISLTMEEAAFLSESDFVLLFDKTEFANLTFEKVANDVKMGGYNDFISVDHPDTQDLMTQMLVQNRYFQGTSTAIKNNQLIVNLDAPKFNAAEQTNELVARLDAGKTYLLGRFKVSGMVNEVAPSISWKPVGQGLVTEAFTYSNALESHEASPMELTLCDKLSPQDTSPDEATGNLNISLYPNPSSKATTLSLELIKDGKTTVTVTDVTGRVVATPMNGETLTEGFHLVQLETDKLASGLYLCTLQSAGKRITRQLAVVH